MMVSTKGRYAIRVMVDLAEQKTDRYIPLTEVAQRQQISEKYLESIVSVLSKSGLVDSLRGKGGGYRLNRPANQYTVGEILRVIEGSMAPVACLGKPVNDCPRLGECRTINMWSGLYKLINDYFDGITVADLAAQGGSQVL